MTARPSPYLHWTHDSGTCEIPSARRGLPLSDLPTSVIDFYLKPELGPQPAPQPRPGRFRRLLLTLGIVGVVVGLLWAITVLNTLSPLSSVR